MRVLVVAVSARMLAELAVADGHEVVACDRFGDADLRALAARVIVAGSADALVAAAHGEAADAVVYGAGLENRPDLVTRLAAGRELLGTPAAALAAVRDPVALRGLVDGADAGARMPETVLAPATAGPGRPDGGGWLRKPVLGGGGRGVRRWRGGALRAGELLQREVAGRSVSAVAVGDGARARLLGVTEQLHHGRGFGWIGNMTPPRLPLGERALLDGQLAAVCTAVAGRGGVRGAFGVDAIWDGAHAWVLEVNPRPTASLELFGRGAFAAHLAGSRGGPLPGARRAKAGSDPSVKLVLFADRDLRAPAPGWWPAGLVRDVPRAGTAIARGGPVCTLLARGRGLEELTALGEELLAGLPRAVSVRG